MYPPASYSDNYSTTKDDRKILKQLQLSEILFLNKTLQIGKKKTHYLTQCVTFGLRLTAIDSFLSYFHNSMLFLKSKYSTPMIYKVLSIQKFVIFVYKEAQSQLYHNGFMDTWDAFMYFLIAIRRRQQNTYSMNPVSSQNTIDQKERCVQHLSQSQNALM